MFSGDVSSDTHVNAMCKSNYAISSRQMNIVTTNLICSEALEMLSCSQILFTISKA